MIPTELNKELNDDPFYTKCCFDFPHTCYGKIERHHNLIYAGSQVQLKEAILPICQNIHNQARITETKEKLDLIMLERMSKEQRLSLSRAINYENRYQYVKNKHNHQRSHSK